MVRSLRSVLILVSCGIWVGCQKGVPEISSLRAVPGFSLDQRSVSVTSKTTPDFVLTGKCKSTFSGIEISLDGGLHWQEVSKLSTDFSIDCATNESFHVRLSLASSPLDLKNWSSQGIYSLLSVRGVSELGYSDSQSLELTNLKPSLGSLTGGSSNVPLSAGAYKLSGEITFHSTSPAMSGGNYKLQGEVLW